MEQRVWALRVAGHCPQFIIIYQPSVGLYTTNLKENGQIVGQGYNFPILMKTSLINFRLNINEGEVSLSKNLLATSEKGTESIL